MTVVEFGQHIAENCYVAVDPKVHQINHSTLWKTQEMMRIIDVFNPEGNIVDMKVKSYSSFGMRFHIIHFNS